MTTQIERPPASRPMPSFGPIWLACKACGHWWDDWQPLNVPVLSWAAYTKTYYCPSCGADSGKLALRVKPLSERPASATPTKRGLV